METWETLVHVWQQGGRVITFSWLGEQEVSADRVYALAFVSDGQMLLVSDRANGSQFWLPGGGVEAGETEEAALARELEEEAAATVIALKKLGVQLADDPQLGPNHHAFYWCRIVLRESFDPQHEISVRRLVAPETFRDTLFWGRADPKGEMLLQAALRCERAYGRP